MEELDSICMAMHMRLFKKSRKGNTVTQNDITLYCISEAYFSKNDS